MGRSAKITRGGDKKRINMHRQEKKIEEARKKEVAAAKKIKKRVRIEPTAAVEAAKTLALQGQAPASALASKEQVMINTVKRLESGTKKTAVHTVRRGQAKASSAASGNTGSTGSENAELSAE